jgi:small subunit ribosomal protein S18
MAEEQGVVPVSGVASVQRTASVQGETPVSSRSPMDFSWKDVDSLSRYITGTGKILPRKYTGLSARQQRHITRMIKRSRHMLLMK